MELATDQLNTTNLVALISFQDPNGLAGVSRANQAFPETIGMLERIDTDTVRLFGFNETDNTTPIQEELSISHQ